jgi:hypothetical protein
VYTRRPAPRAGSCTCSPRDRERHEWRVGHAEAETAHPAVLAEERVQRHMARTRVVRAYDECAADPDLPAYSEWRQAVE